MNKHLLIMYMFGIAGCSNSEYAATAVSATAGLDFNLAIVEDSNTQRFTLSLTSKTQKNLCVAVDDWPNKLGQMHFAQGEVYIQTSSGRFDYLYDRNFGYCVSDKCVHQIAPGQTLKGYVAFSEFDEAAFNQTTEQKTLNINVHPYFCVPAR